MTSYSRRQDDLECILKRALNKDISKSVMRKWISNNAQLALLNVGSIFLYPILTQLGPGTGINQADGDSIKIKKLQLSFNATVNASNGPQSAVLAVWILQSKQALNVAAITPLPSILQDNTNILSPINFGWRSIVDEKFYKRYLLTSHNVTPGGSVTGPSISEHDDIVLYEKQFGPVKINTSAAPNSVEEGFIYVMIAGAYANQFVSFSCFVDFVDA
jgi:hypothetical protein